jgi:hypothetical protein
MTMIRIALNATATTLPLALVVGHLQQYSRQGALAYARNSSCQ